jgi:hypothetical protein
MKRELINVQPMNDLGTVGEKKRSGPLAIAFDCSPEILGLAPSCRYLPVPGRGPKAAIEQTLGPD